MLVMSAASCAFYASQDPQPDATTAEPPVDACALPLLPPACVANAFDAVSPDGEWRMTGSAETTVYGGSGSATTTTTTIDEQVFIHRYGCVAGFGSSAMPAANERTVAGPSGISFSCDHNVGCPRGTSHWSICVNADGEMSYQETSYRTSTMPGAYQTTYTVTAVLSR